MKRKISLHIVIFVLLCLVGMALTQNVYARGVDANGSWAATGNLQYGRIGHTATLLTNGKVLVAGGNSSPSAELYDPKSGKWSVTGSMKTARSGHSATLLSNGKVLVVGGSNESGSLTSVEMYDPGSGTWSATGSMNTARSNMTSTLLSNGKVLVVGGYNTNGSLVSAEVYDPGSGTWSETGSMTAARSGYTATLLASGKVLVAGGFDSNRNNNLASAELYDPASGSWSLTGSMNDARWDHTATLLLNGKVLVTGGDYGRAELYDPASGKWTLTGNLNVTRYSGQSATLLPNGKVLVAGGYIGYRSYQHANPYRAFPLRTDTTSAELYDPASGSWTQTGSMTMPREQHTATLLTNGKVLVLGGYSYPNGANSATTAELFSYPDSTPPVLRVPGTITVNATSLKGAVVTYSVMASDPDTDASWIKITCTPPSGSLFPSKTTTVQCSASDPAGNVGRASFQVIVNGEARQIGDLIQLLGSFRLQATIQQSLELKLRQARNVLNQENEGPACQHLSDFSQQVSSLSRTSLTEDQASRLLSSSGSIRLVLGCGSSVG